jgi:hypothetical protein
MVIQLHPVTELPGHATEHRRQMRALFRCMVVHLERAALLDIRADQSGNPVLAGLLRERAVQHRRRADGVRSQLVAEGALRRRPPGTLRAAATATIRTARR